MALSKMFDDISAMATVNRTCQEIVDLTSAVEEMLKRLFSGEIVMHYEGLKFHKAYPQQCGSMEEKTSLWKSTRRGGSEDMFIEHDYLVVLDSLDKIVEIKRKCDGCCKIYRENKALRSNIFNWNFLESLYIKIHDMCDCLVDLDATSLENKRHDRTPCDKCTVVRNTGFLQVVKIRDHSKVTSSEHCSLVLFWYSNTGSLLAPNVDTLQPTHKIERLKIRVDIMPAFELPGDGDQSGIKRFVIAKICPYCRKFTCFMVSYCMHELNSITHVSEKHKQTFTIIKFLYGQFLYWTGGDEFMNSYHAKVAFLTHCQTCTDNQKDCITCVTEIVQSLVEAYRSGSLRLPEFHPVESLKLQGSIIPLLSLSHILSQLNSRSENLQCRPCDVIDHIKRTCLMLLEDGQTRILDVDERPLENTVPVLNILGVLLGDKDLCNHAADNELYRADDKLYRRLPCPEPEKPLLYYRTTCMAKMIRYSDIADIRDVTIKNAVKIVQDVRKERFYRLHGHKQFQFLTISQTVPEISASDPDNASSNPRPDRRCDTSHENAVKNVQDNDRMMLWRKPRSDERSAAKRWFTDDLRLNWSAFTDQRMDELRLEIERREEEERRAEEEEARERIRRQRERWEIYRREDEIRAEEEAERERRRCCCILL